MEVMFNKQFSAVADVDVGLMRLSLIESCTVLRKMNPTVSCHFLLLRRSIVHIHLCYSFHRPTQCVSIRLLQLEPSTSQLIGIDNDILIWIRKSLAFWLAKRLTKHDLACRFVGRDLRRTWDDRRSHLFQITVGRLQIAFQPKNVFSQLRYSN